MNIDVRMPLLSGSFLLSDITWINLVLSVLATYVSRPLSISSKANFEVPLVCCIPNMVSPSLKIPGANYSKIHESLCCVPWMAWRSSCEYAYVS